MKTFFFVLIFQILLFSMAHAQMERFRIGSKYSGMNLKPEFSLLGGLSIPQGEYAALTDRLSEQGGARQGFYVEARLMHRPLTHPLWSIGAHLGHFRHGVAEEDIRLAYDLAVFRAPPWAVTYLMPSVAFRAGKTLKVELFVAAGAVVFNGWNATRAEFGKNQSLNVDEWNFDNSVGAAIKGDLTVGYKIGNRWEVFFNASHLFGRGLREGDWIISEYNTDPATQLPIQPPLSTETKIIPDKVLFSSTQLALGMKYDLYKYFYDPNRRYWDYY